MTSGRGSGTVPPVIRSSAFLLLFSVFASPVWAADAATAPSLSDTAQAAPSLDEPVIPPSVPPELAAEDLSLGWTLVRTMVVLVMVVVLAWLVLNVGLRKLMGIRPALGSSVVRVLERVTLDQKRALFVVEAAGEVLLIGGGEGALALIAKLDGAEIEKMKAQRASDAAQMSPFLQKLLGRRNANTPPPPAG